VGTTNELIQRLHESRLKAAEEHKALVEEVEARGGGWTAEDDGRKAKIDLELDSLKGRIDSLIDQQELNASLEEQRAKFETMIRPEGDVVQDEEHAEDRFRKFLRAGLPGYEDEHAPKRVDVAITPEIKRYVHAARRAGRSVADLELHDLLKGTTTAGGFTVPTSFAARLYEHLVERAAVRQTRAEVLTTSSGENIQVPKTTSHGADATIVGEAAPLPEADPAFGQVTLGAFKYAKLVQVSSELAQDTAIDLLGYVARAAGLALGQGSGAHFVTGTGTAGGGGAQPEGVMTNITAGKTMPTGNTAGFTTAGTAADSLFDLIHSVVSGYRQRGEWLMNDTTLAAARKIRDTTNQYLWAPGLSAGVPDSLLSYPVVTDPNVAPFGVSAKVAAFGDFSLYYTIRDVDSVRFERSDEFAFANDLITFRAIIRTDGRVIDTNAVKSLVSSAT
jgi:HK97 family phage major capsid protein